MSNFKHRVEGLLASTTSDQAITACKEALTKFSEYASFNVTTQVAEQFEATIAEALIASIENIDEAAVNDFLVVEKRILGMNNLGVRKAINALRESELAQNPASLYVIESLVKIQHQPEWMTINAVIERLSAFEWNSLVKEHLATLRANAGKYAEDIKIYAAVHEAKNSRSNFVISGLEKDINAYLDKRTATNRTKLIESLGKYNYDPNVRKLYNTIIETERTFQLKANSNDAVVTKVYSPVIINEKEEIFAVHGKAYVKRGEDVRPLTEEETKILPSYFTWVSTFMSQPNVEVSENRVKVFSFDKKVEIIEEDNNISININGKNVSREEFHNIYLKSGIFRMQEREVINAVSQLLENWHSIFELDFAKSVHPKGAPNRRVDIFKIGNKMHINRVDSVMQENTFYADCNATQSRNMVLEFANYDLGNTFANVLTEEEKTIREIQEKKKEALASIDYLNSKKSMLENHPDAEIRESEEVKDILVSIDEEISTVKAEYFELQNREKSLTHVQEGLGAIAGDEVEYLKKKQ